MVALRWTMKNALRREARRGLLGGLGRWLGGRPPLHRLRASCSPAAPPCSLCEGKPVGTPDAGAFRRVDAEHGAVRSLFTAPTPIPRHQEGRPEGQLDARTTTSQLPHAVPRGGERADPDTVSWALAQPAPCAWWILPGGRSRPVGPSPAIRSASAGCRCRAQQPGPGVLMPGYRPRYRTRRATLVKLDMHLRCDPAALTGTTPPKGRPRCSGPSPCRSVPRTSALPCAGNRLRPAKVTRGSPSALESKLARRDRAAPAFRARIVADRLRSEPRAVHLVAGLLDHQA